MSAARRTDAPPPRVTLEAPSLRRQADFIAAVRRSRALHGALVSPPSTPAAYKTLLRRSRTPSKLAHFVCTAEGELAGVININEIVRDGFQSGYLGYYAFVPHAGRGVMRAGLAEVLRLAFREYGLHRLEANIQPGNMRSIALARGLGFRYEGLSPRYLKLAGRWRDHERWALTVEDWKA
jgi:ribosomal-protein-alanine N-acetyltransferase